jgi:hypothetical protein
VLREPAVRPIPVHRVKLWRPVVRLALPRQDAQRRTLLCLLLCGHASARDQAVSVTRALCWLHRHDCCACCREKCVSLDMALMLNARARAALLRAFVLELRRAVRREGECDGK